MKLWRVDDVMTTAVVSVVEATPYRELVGALIANRVSALPVVDRSGEVVGVVSEADLALKLEAAGEPLRRLRFTRRHRSEQRKAIGRTAADLMTSPAVVVARSMSLAAAARRMHETGVKRMPVVDDTGRLVGIVTRGDLLKVHLRSDAEIRRDVIAEVRESVLSARGSTVQVTTTDGVVTLTGRVQYRSTAQRITALARRVPGVVEVVARVRYDTDDSPVADSIIGVA